MPQNQTKLKSMLNFLLIFFSFLLYFILIYGAMFEHAELIIVNDF